MFNKNSSKNEVTSVSEGHVYKDEDGLEVIPFFVDLGASSVKFAPLGRSKEGNVSIDDFLKDFTYVGVQSAHAEKPSSKSAPAEKK